jgi:uncharacterized protein
MSSTERAPEPTMEEILASIRRIISDDEANAAAQPEPVADYSEQMRADDVDDGAADTKIIDDIARVLSAGSAPPAGEGDDDILDLTEPGLASEPASEPVGEAAEDEILLISEEVLLTEEVSLADEEPAAAESYAAPNFAAAFPPAAPAYAEPTQNYTEPVESYAEPTYAEPLAAEPPAAELVESYTEQSYAEPPAAEPNYAGEAESASDDPTTALERAIAALKAGDLSAFARESQFSFGQPAAAAPPLAAAPFGELAPEPLPEPMPEPVAAESETVLALVEEEPFGLEEPVLLDEPAPEPLPWSAASASWPHSETRPEPEAAPPPWRSEELSWGTSGSVPPPAPVKVNGGSKNKLRDFEAAVSSKSLEDSVKEMLRPMLRQWLDENMPRVLTAALRDELDNSEMDRRGS